ncbi:hypothetical protein GCM10009085_54480 [Pseudomonas avellanae]|nr:hypothetical protein GCM10009085_54480 [Pseudomonas avellanae]
MVADFFENSTLGDLPSIPPKLPQAAEKRLKQVSNITSALSIMPDFLTNKKALNAKIKQIAASLDLTEKTGGFRG